MSKQQIILLTFFFSFFFSLSAERITPEEALLKASEVLKTNSTRSSSLSTLSLDTYGNEIYVINSPEGGWMLIGNEDRLPQPILAYSLTGHYSLYNLPVNAKSQLEMYANEIATLPKDVELTKTLNTRTASAVAPLLGSTEWGQGEPYNRLCPILDGIRTVTGCTNTALSQIM